MTQTNFANKLGHQHARPSCDICQHFPKRHQLMWVKMPWSTEAHGIVNYINYIYIHIPLCQHIPTTSHLISLAEISISAIPGPDPPLDPRALARSWFCGPHSHRHPVRGEYPAGAPRCARAAAFACGTDHRGKPFAPDSPGTGVSLRERATWGANIPNYRTG